MVVAIGKLGSNRTTHYDWAKADPEYAAAIASAFEDRADMLEEEAFRRAYKGVEKPVFQQGKKVGTVREYSDTLMLALLKAHRPEKFKDRQEITGPKGGPLETTVRVDLSQLTKEELRELRRIHNRITTAGSDRGGTRK